MNDQECVALLQWALPRLGLRWRGFKNLRRQVCRRIAARAAELGFADAASYRQRLEDDPEELARFDALCFVTISRFYRDHQIFDLLREKFLPELAETACGRGATALRIWSAGCASGEEPYTVSMLWELELAKRFPALALEILATDFDAVVLARAARGVYEASSLSELPEVFRTDAFELQNGLAIIRPGLRAITFERRDIRTFLPAEKQDLVLCRNVAFTYFDEAAQRAFLERLVPQLVSGGLLVIGGHESLPAGDFALEPTHESPHILVNTSRR